LKNIKKLDLPPAKVVCSSYYATVDEEECTGCEACVESCQMDAITIEDDTAQVILGTLMNLLNNYYLGYVLY
jgi:ferredoxin